MSEIEEHRPGEVAGRAPDGVLPAQGSELMREAAVEDVPGAPTWPIPSRESIVEPEAPPVGLSWTKLARTLDIDPRVLRHEGAIVLTGEYVPEAGLLIDATSLSALQVHTGDRALSHSYFIGEVTMSQFLLHIRLDAGGSAVAYPIVRTASAPIIGLFAGERDANRAREQIMQGSIGSGLSLDSGSLGIELRVQHASVAGRVATVIASHRGAVTSVGGQSLA